MSFFKHFWSAPVFIFFLIFVNLGLRYNTLSFSIFDWDEITYLIVAKGWTEGKIPFVDLWDIKPIGTYAIYYPLILIFGYSIETIRLTTLILISGSAFLVSSFMKFRPIAILSSFTYIYSFFYFKSGLSGNTEPFFIFFELLGVYFLWQRSSWNFKIASFFLGIAFMIKYIIIFDLIWFFLFSYFFLNNQKEKKSFSQFLRFGFNFLPFMIPILLTISYYAINGHLNELINVTHIVMTSHSKSAGFLNILEFFSSFKFIFFPLFLLSFLILTFHFFKKSTFNRIPILFFLGWIITSSFGAIKTGFLFEHYLLAIIPSIILFNFTVFDGILSNEFSRNHLKIKMSLLYFCYMVLIFFAFKDFKKFSKTMAKIPDLNRNIANEIKNDGDGSLFVASGFHAAYIHLNQIPPVKYVQPVNYIDKEFSENFKINVKSVLSDLEKNKPKYIQWCESLELPFNKDLEIPGYYNRDYIIGINDLIKNRYLFWKSFDSECKLYKLRINKE